MVGIYKIQSPSGKIYIGQSIDIERRFKKYKNGNISKIQPKLFNSFFKYGIDNHTFEIIEECSPETLTERESYWIDAFKCTTEGLNIREAGAKGKQSKKTREKISLSLTGRSITWGDKIGEKNKGQKRSEEVKQVLSNLRSEYWESRYSEIYANAESIQNEYHSGTSKRKLMSKYCIGYDTLNNILNYL